MTPKSDIYGTDVYAYLWRARRLLDSLRNDALFYAAFELRCGIESRLQQYLDARQDIAKRKKKGWRLAAANHELSKVFRDGRTVVELVVSSPNLDGEIRLYYTPVRPSLVEAGERLGNLLHRSKVDRETNDPWWNGTRKTLEDTFSNLADASRGTLLGPPMMSPNGTDLDLKVFYNRANRCSGFIEQFGSLPRGTRAIIGVQYHADIPQHAEHFLNRWQDDSGE